MAFEGGGTDVRKNLMKPDTDGIEIGFPDRILALLVLLRRFSSLSPDMKSIYILYSGSELAISLPSEDRIFPRLGFTRYILFDEAVGYIVPVLSLGKT